MEDENLVTGPSLLRMASIGWETFKSQQLDVALLSLLLK
jgi:hypothetical protein